MTAMIRYLEGDLFEHVPSKCKADQTIYLCHCCNDCGAMGAGFALVLAKRFPKARREYLKWYRGEETTISVPFKLGITQFVGVLCKPRVTVCNMISQHGFVGARPLRYNALASSMDHVAGVILADRETKCWPEIHAPCFGSDLARGDWHFIEQLIDDCWLKKGIPVTIHYLSGKLPA